MRVEGKIRQRGIFRVLACEVLCELLSPRRCVWQRNKQRVMPGKGRTKDK